MMKVILSNGTELTPELITFSPKYVEGQRRDTLNFIFSARKSMEDIDEVFKSENCDIIILEDKSNKFTYEGYTLRSELSKKSILIAEKKEDSSAVYEERILVSMSKKTHSESEMENFRQMLADADETVISLYEAQETQENINVQQDDALMELYEMFS